MTPEATRTLHRALLLLAAIGFAIAAIVLLTRDASAPGWKATQQRYFALKGEGGAPQMRAVPITWAASEHPTGWTDAKTPPEAVALDRCMTCHLGADDPQMGAADVPRELRVHPKRDELFKSHPVADFGCSSCHGGNSAATDMTAHAAPDFRAGGPSMQASCGGCHTIDEHLAGADTFARGRKLFVELDCGGCHRAPGPAQHDRAASMFDAPVKTSAAWLLAWLRDPAIAGASSASTRHMPAFWPKADAVAKKETLDVAAFLFARGDGEGRRAKVRGYANVPGASADEGEVLWKALGCRSCHTEIGGHATEDFIAYYIEDPARLWAHTRMPSFRLVRREAASLAKYLERAAAARPSYMDPTAVPGVDADEIAIVTTGARRAERAPCGAANDVVLSHVECGEKIAASRGCASCHASEGIVLERRDAIDLHAWGKSPGTPADRASRVALALGGNASADAGVHNPASVASAMPKYTLAADDVTALATYLEGLRGGSPRPPFDPYMGTRRGETLAGEALWERLRCDGCHARGGSRPVVEGAPSLDGEGQRAQAEWLAIFLRDPGAHGVRPSVHPEWAWGELVPLSKLATRMPTFALTNEERTAIVRWLALSDGGVFPYGAPDPPRFVPDEVMSTLVFVNRAEPSNGACMTCHFTGAFPVERAKAHAGALAPNLGGVRTRLRPDWVRKLLVGQVPMTPHAATVPKERVDRVTDFLFTLGEHTELPRPGDEGRTPILGLPR